MQIKLVSGLINVVLKKRRIILRSSIANNEESHFAFLDRHFDTILTRMGKEEYISCTGNFVSSGDKYRQYFMLWEHNNVPYFHGAAMYHILELIFPDEARHTTNGWVDPWRWVIENYRSGHNLSQYMEDLE